MFGAGGCCGEVDGVLVSSGESGRCGIAMDKCKIKKVMFIANYPFIPF